MRSAQRHHHMWTPLLLSLVIEPGAGGRRRDLKKVANFWPRLKGRLARSHRNVRNFQSQFKNVKFEISKSMFWIWDFGDRPDMEAPPRGGV